jgi:hypothetical protein
VRVCLFVLAFMVSVPLLPLYAQSPSSLQHQLVGTWRLVAAGQQLADGSRGPDPQAGWHGIGYIMYTRSGHMCAVITNPDRPQWKVPAAPTDAEVRAAFEGLVSYCGTYAINEQEHYVVHHLEMGRDPNAAGTVRKRYVTINGKRLVLRPDPLPVGVKDWTVEWERVE